MIVVLMGAKPAGMSSIVKQLKQDFGVLLNDVDVSTLPTTEARLARLKNATFDARFGRLTLVVNPQTAEEVAFLREKRAQFLHIYRGMTPLYNEIAVERTDLWVASVPFRQPYPDHVMDPYDAVMECKHRHQVAKSQNKRRRAA